MVWGTLMHVLFKTDLRNTPQINFVLDNSIEHGTHISKLINQVCKDSDE